LCLDLDPFTGWDVVIEEDTTYMSVDIRESGITHTNVEKEEDVELAHQFSSTSLSSSPVSGLNKPLESEEPTFTEETGKESEHIAGTDTPIHLW
jgi:hypothetical protein